MSELSRHCLRFPGNEGGACIHRGRESEPGPGLPWALVSWSGAQQEAKAEPQPPGTPWRWMRMCGEAPAPLMPRGHEGRSERAGVLGAWPTPAAQVLSWASCVQQAHSCRATFLGGGGWGTNVQCHPPQSSARDCPTIQAVRVACPWLQGRETDGPARGSAPTFCVHSTRREWRPSSQERAAS